MATNFRLRSRNKPLREVYVWELPVRLFHWINALCILILCITGFMIGDPPAFQSSGQAYDQYWFGQVRYIHFIFAFIFTFNFIFRLYWGFVGNVFSRWYNYIPLHKSQWIQMYNVLRVDILQIKNRPVATIGHNSMASTIYFLLFLAFIAQVFTGFALIEPMSTNYLPGWLFTWISPILGGDMMVRQIHHFLMWFFILVAIVHVYLVIYHDYIDSEGITSSMIGGWKFIPAKEVEHFEAEESKGKKAVLKDLERLDP